MGTYFQIENLFWVGFVAAAAALGYALFQALRVLKLPGDAPVDEFSRAVRLGTLAFFKRSCMVGAPLFTLAGGALFALEYLVLSGELILTAAFFAGGICVAVASLAALALAVFTNSRTAAAVEGGTHNGFNAAFSAGSAAAFGAVGLALLEVFAWFHILRYGLYYDLHKLVSTMVLFGAGSTYAALLSRLCGGIFAKAADLSAGPPSGSEDEIMEVRRGPGAVADCVGDNALGVAGVCADLYSGYVLTVLAALCMAVLAFENDTLLWNTLIYPVAVLTAGTVCSIISCLLVKARENSEERTLLHLMRKGAWVSALLTAAVTAPISYLLTGTWGPWAAVVIGLLAARAVDHLAVRTSSNLYQATRRLALTAESGVSAALSGASSMGLRSACAAILVLIVSVLLSFLSTGGQLDTAYEVLYGNALAKGLYGVALAGTGAVSTLGYALSAALMAPILDNADCAVKVAGLDKTLQNRASILNSLGGSLANLGRALSAGISFLSVPVLAWIYTSGAKARSGALSFAATGPALLAGAFLGVILIAFFISLLLSGVQSCIQPMAVELRRQLREANRLGEKADPDYTACVDLCARSAAMRSILPGLFAVLAPLVTAVFLGSEGTVGFLFSSALLGLSGALFLSAAGSALDCARRRVELERRGGAETRRSAVVADMVGDLFKDLLGPCLGILVRVCFTLALLLTVLATGYNILSLPG